jgi:hypothetical protein
MKKLLLGLSFWLAFSPTKAQNIQNNPHSNHGNKFEQLGSILADPNNYRTASGAPGHQYWQQQADYEIEAQLDEKQQILSGKERIVYHNNSPDLLGYLWLQLDENQHDPANEANNFNESSLRSPLTQRELDQLDFRTAMADHGVKILSVSDDAGKALPYTIVHSMMRIDLPKPLLPGKKLAFRIQWQYRIPERMRIGGRGGYESFPDGHALYTITQWFPRLCVYSDYQGWNNKQFTGRGEFALVFGNYSVKMDVPADHVVAATGVCQNLPEVLSSEQLSRWKKAINSDEPIEVVSRAEALAREQQPDYTGRKTWHFKAENVRDFAWGSSRKFIWDAMGTSIEGRKTPVMAMSYYPKESYALYRKYSTKVVAHTLRVYSKHTIPYPYPVAISVEAANGMEYPMICFNYGRTDEDGTYTEQTKYGMIGVIIHEVGHNFFPMIINSDERNWSWMDEGLNTFVQFLAEQEFDNQYPSRRGPAHKIVDYMKLPPEELEPIMTNSENILNFGANAYGKPATALNILRETIMGRELFDFAFREYARRWAFKHPAPADFFRTMEDASGVDLDWFWRAWFYDITPVDISLDTVLVMRPHQADTMPKARNRNRETNNARDPFVHISQARNKASGMQFLVETDTSLLDFYNRYDPETDSFKAPAPNPYKNWELIDDSSFAVYADKWYYELHFSNKGGTVMPIILRWTYTDGSSEDEYISAYIWRKNEAEIVKTFVKNKEVSSIQLDPWRETADIDESNHRWPKENKAEISRLQLYKTKQSGGRTRDESNNPMQRLQGKP